jgi:hypothetical protein
MGKASTPRKTRAQKIVGFEDDGSTAAARSIPAPTGTNDQIRKRECKSFANSPDFHCTAHMFIVTCQPPNTQFEVEDREDQGLCVHLDGSWWPAIWHHELVAILDKHKYGVHLYDFEPPRRNDTQAPQDITSFLANQKRWDFERKEHRPDIIFQLYPYVDQFPDRNKAVPWLGIEVRGVMRIVLDIFSRRPLRDFKNIPLQLATNVEGGRLEAMCREDCRIDTEDFLQRMIPVLDVIGEPQRDGQGAVFSERPLKNPLNNVKTQFRNKCRCLSWNTFSHDSAFDKRLLSEITKADIDTNTTKNLPDLSCDEITEVRSLAKGRRSKVTGATEDTDSEATARNDSGPDLEQSAANLSVQTSRSNRAAADAEKYRDVQPSRETTLDSMWKRVIDTGLVAKRRRGRPKATKKTQNVDSGAPFYPRSGPPHLRTEDAVQHGFDINHPTLTTVITFPPSADYAHQNGSHPNDPARIARGASAPSTDKQDHLALPESSGQPTAVTPIEPSQGAAAGTMKDHLDEDQSTLKRKLTGGEENSDSSAIEVNGYSGHEAESSVPSPKRQRIKPPTDNVHQLLADFSATSRSGSPALNFGNAHNFASFSNAPAGSVQQRPENPQLYGPHGRAPIPPNSTPLIRPRSCSPAPPNSAPFIQPRPYSPAPSNSASLVQPTSYSPVPPKPTAEHNEASVIRTQQARFASVTYQVSEHEVLKATLMRGWKKQQVDTANGGALYGPTLNIHVSQLGRNTSVRTDTEVRTFLSGFEIPPHWSLSSIDLRQNPALREAVHNAMCESDRFDYRNYRQDLPNVLNIDTEGGFFLAPSQISVVGFKDGRFWNFISTSALNASLHSATWRYKQLTGRDFYPPEAGDAFLAQDCTYHAAWCEIRRQVFLPYFLRFADPVEAMSWMPELGFLARWEGSPENWQRCKSHATDVFGCWYDLVGRRALDLSVFGKGWGNGKDDGKGEVKISMPLASVELEGRSGVA